MAKIGGTLLYNKSGDKVLLLLRDNGNWDLPKGHVEPGESVIDGARRETREETGITPHILQLADDEDHGDDNIKIYVAASMTDTVKLSHEHVDYKWVTVAQAIQDLYPPLARIVNRLAPTKLRESQMDHLDEGKEVDSDGHVTCGVFLPLPYDIAKYFPNKDHEDDSVPHITLLFAGKMCPEGYRKFARAVGRIARKAHPFDLDLSSYGEFLNPKGQRIPHMSPSFCNRHKLAVLHGILRRAVEAEGIKCEHTYGPQAMKGLPYEVTYRPHATLDYLSPCAGPYRGPKPTGAWKVTELECWGHETIKFPLGRTRVDQPVGLRRSALSLIHSKYPSAVHEDDHDDQLPGGLADNSKPSDFDPKQLAMGIRVELEHANSLKVAREIAMDHLKEDPRYYTKLRRIEPQHEAETSLKGYERHADPGAKGSTGGLGGGLGIESDPRYQDWLDDVEAGKTKKPFRA